jgi:hypothetical protein
MNTVNAAGVLAGVVDGRGHFVDGGAKTLRNHPWLLESGAGSNSGGTPGTKHYTTSRLVWSMASATLMLHPLDHRRHH